MTGVEGERKYVNDDKFIGMLVIHIENDGEMMDRIKGFMAAGEQQLPIVIFQFARVKTFQEANANIYFCDGCNKDVNNVVDRYKLDLLSFDGTTTTTFVVFDKKAAVLFGRTCTEMVKELNEKEKASKDPTGFKDFFFDKEFLVKVEVKTTGWCDSYDVSVISYDPTILARKRSIEQLKLFEEGSIYCVLATGLEVINHGDWWVPIYECGKTIMVIEVAYLWRLYQIKMRVVDHSSSVTFVLHDRKGRAILKKSCSEILNWFQTEGRMIDQPPDFAQLLGKEIIFKIVNEFKSLKLPVNLVQSHSEDGCFVCDESLDPIVKNCFATKRPIVGSLLNEFNMFGAPSIKKKH
ncbi:uncharacterized protein LOC107627407 [Arachis ipaensis]|uniref:uncharacterized protein LOC107627407 n=1 Tax=Arachis ipaensis TaxID=130454 RepID=UPI0007AF19F9|nr:uncharacterized protein LOC107627407 [Arachis ipaensis]